MGPEQGPGGIRLTDPLAGPSPFGWLTARRAEANDRSMRRGWSTGAAVIAVVSLLALTAAAAAAPGDLDLGFGVDGTRIIDLGGYDSAEAIALQADGRIVTAGSSETDFVVARFLANGSPDPAFGGGTGRVTIDFGGYDRATDVALQGDGKIVVVGTTSVGNDIAVARLLGSGALDAEPILAPNERRLSVIFPGGPIASLGFDGDGRKTIDLGGADGGGAVAVQPDGRILIAGHNGGAGSNISVIRLFSGGSPDTSFDGDGTSVIDLGRSEFAEAVALQPDGRILVAGSGSRPTNGSDAIVVRLLPKGAPDADFGNGGTVRLPSVGSGGVEALAVQADRRIVATGIGGTSRDVSAWRLLSDGAPDPDFGAGGNVTIDLGSTFFGKYGYGVAVQPNGKVVIAATNDRKYTSEAWLLRLQPGGSPDTTFDRDGRKQILPGNGYGNANDVALQADGKILLGGAIGAGTLDTALVRVLGDEPVGGPGASPGGGAGGGGAVGGPGTPAGAAGGKVPRCAGRAATIVGTARRDVLRGTPRADVIAALGGNDVVRGLGGADVVCGGAGKDLLIGGPGADRLLGQQGRDTLRGGGGRDLLTGGAGRDACLGGLGVDRAVCERKGGL